MLRAFQKRGRIADGAGGSGKAAFNHQNADGITIEVLYHLAATDLPAIAHCVSPS